MLFCFTFVVMVGGNPQGDAFGFRNWGSPPGAFNEYRTTGNLGRFEGFLAGLWSACFTVVGPEYISMVAAEAKRPRTYIKTAFKTVYFRFGLFFILGAMCVGILVAHNDPTLKAIVDPSEGDTSGSGKSGTAAASPYVIAMQNLKIRGLPSFVNALLVTSIFSAGNTYTYCATRSLYGLALEGRAPKFLRTCTKNGVPIYCFCVVMCFPCLAFLQLGSGSATVLKWLINLITAGGLINYIVMTTTYIFFWRACKAQGVDRKSLPYTGWFQPYSAYLGLAWMIVMVTCYGYSSFKPWGVDSFFTYYTMLLLLPLTFGFWKLFRRTKFRSPLEVDLVWERPLIDAYESSLTEPPTSMFYFSSQLRLFSNTDTGFWREMAVFFRLTRKHRPADAAVIEHGHSSAFRAKLAGLKNLRRR